MPDCIEVSSYTVNDLYPESLSGLCKLFRRVLGDNVQSKCWFGTFYRWFEQDVILWESEKRADHHLTAFGGMGSVNDLAGPAPSFPGGEEGFDRFAQALDLFKELSYTCAKLWEIKRRETPERMNEPLPIRLWGVPVRIGSCEAGHQWAKDKLSDSFYFHHASRLAEMRLFMSMVAKRGGENMVDRLYENPFTYDPEPVLEEMRTALIRAGIGERLKDCVPCRAKNVAMETLYLIGNPLTLSKEYD